MRALARLRQLLIDGDVAPGQRLLEKDLVERLGVSRSPLRLVLAMLEHEGLVERLPTGGHVARAFTAADLAEIVELRGLIEGAAARRAAECRSRDDATVQRMRQLCADMELALCATSYAEALRAYFHLDREFHELILSLTGSVVSARSLRMLQMPLLTKTSPDHMLQGPSIHDLRVMQSQHRALVDAIDRGESARAESIVREHAFQFRNAIESRFAKRLAPRGHCG